MSRWLVDDGHPVAAGQIVVEVETDKATVEIEAPEAGLLRIVAAEGEVVAVDGVLAEVEPAAAASPRRRLRRRRPPRRRRPTGPLRPRTPRRDGPIASPAARRLAREQGVELDGPCRERGPGGRIVARDLAAAPATPAPPSTTGSAPRSSRTSPRAGSRSRTSTSAASSPPTGSSRARASALDRLGVTVTDLLVVALAARARERCRS